MIGHIYLTLRQGKTAGPKGLPLCFEPPPSPLSLGRILANVVRVFGGPHGFLAGALMLMMMSTAAVWFKLCFGGCSQLVLPLADKRY